MRSSTSTAAEGAGACMSQGHFVCTAAASRAACASSRSTRRIRAPQWSSSPRDRCLRLPSIYGVPVSAHAIRTCGRASTAIQSFTMRRTRSDRRPLATVSGPGFGSVPWFRNRAYRCLAEKLVPHAELKVYPGTPHGLTDTHKQRLNADLTTFAKGWPRGTVTPAARAVRCKH